MKKTALIALVAAMAIVASACTIDVERNSDGSLQIGSVTTAEALEVEFELDPENDDVEIDIRDGMMFIAAEGTERSGESFVASLTAEISLSGDRLHVDIVEAVYNGWDIPGDIVQEWDDAIAQVLTRAARENPDATLVRVVADNDQIEMEWRVETRESRGR